MLGAQLLVDACDDKGMIRDEVVDEGIRGVEFKLAHLAAEIKEEVVGEGREEVHHEDAHPNGVFHIQHGCQSQLVKSAEVPSVLWVYAVYTLGVYL